LQTEDGYIVRKCLNGDPAAFGLLVDKYKAGVYALAYSKLLNFQDAEDVTQEVFIKAYRKLRTLRRWGKFVAWLYSITYSQCKNYIRARSRRPDSEFIEDQHPDLLEKPSMDSYRAGLVCELVHEALDSLPEMYRQVLTLYYLGGMRSGEIAEFLGVSSAAIRQRLSRARAQLKEGMLPLMSQTFESQRLQANFTFSVAETVKQVDIQPTP
jgi:RNA polymerase sigma-70 factor (ECF subfamily)